MPPFGQLVGEDETRCSTGVRTTTATACWVVATCASGCTRSTLAASVVTSSVESIQAPSATTRAICVADRDEAQPPARDRPHAPRRREHDLHRRPGRARPRRTGAASSVGEAGLDVLAQLVGVVREPQQVEHRHLARVQARVADRQPVGDDRRAGGARLQAGDAAGGVHEHVGGREQLGHAVGEAVDVDARL